MASNHFITLLSITILFLSSLQIITSLTCEPICSFDFQMFFPPQCNNIKCHTPQCYYQCDTPQLQQECDSSPFSKPICTAVCTKQAFNSIDINSHCISKCQPAKDICSKCTLQCSTPSCSLACNPSTIGLTTEQIKQQPTLQQRYNLNCIQHEICQDTQHSIIATITTKDKLSEDYSDGLLIYDDELSSDHSHSSQNKNKNQPRYNVTHSHQQAREQQQYDSDDFDEEESTFGISHLIKKHTNTNDINDDTIHTKNNKNNKNDDNNSEEETCTDQDDFDHDVEHQNDLEPLDPTSTEPHITPHKLKKLSSQENNNNNNKKNKNTSLEYNKVNNKDIIYIEQCCNCRNIDNLSLSYKSATNRIMKSTLHYNELNIPTLTELIQYYHTTQFPTCCQCASKEYGDDNITTP